MTNPNVNPIDAAIAAAEKAQADSTPATNQVDLVPTTGQGGVATYSAPKAPSVDDLMTGSMNVDGYLKVKENTLLIDNKPNLIETIKVKIDMKELMPFTGIKYGNPVVYQKTYDGITAASGGSWADALAKAQRIDPQVRPYMGADLQMELTEDAKDVKGAKVADAGLRLGHSTSTTNRNELASFLKTVKEAGYMNESVEVEIGFKRMTNKNGQSWGLLTFKLLGVAE